MVLRSDHSKTHRFLVILSLLVLVFRRDLFSPSQGPRPTLVMADFDLTTRERLLVPLVHTHLVVWVEPSDSEVGDAVKQFCVFRWPAFVVLAKAPMSSA